MAAEFPRVLWRVARILFITHQFSWSCTRDEGFRWVSEWLWFKKLCSGIFSNMVEARIDVKQCVRFEGESLDVNARDVFDYDPDVYPLEVLAIFDIVSMNTVGRINPLFEKHISVRNHNPSGWFLLLLLVQFFKPIFDFWDICTDLGCVLIRCWSYYPDPVVINRGNFIWGVVMIIGLICVTVIVFLEMNVFSSCWLVVHNRCQ